MQETDESAPVADGDVGVLRPAPSRARSTRSTAAGPRGEGPTPRRSCSTRTCSPTGTTTSRSAASRSRPTTDVLAYSVDFNGGERYTLRFRDLDDRRRPPRRRRRRHLRARVGRRRAHVLLRAARRRDAPERGVAPRARHARGRRRARVPRGRRALLRRHRPHPHRPLRAHRHRRRSSRRRCGSSRPTRPTPRRSVIAPREHGHEYTVEHHVNDTDGDRFLIVTNAGRRAGTSSSSPRRCADPGRDNWTAARPAPRRRAARRASNAFADHLVLSERADGLERLRVLQLDDGDVHDAARRPIPCTACGSGRTPSSTPRTLRYGYTSLVAPVTDVDYDLDTGASTRREDAAGARRLRRRRSTSSARLWATAPDGTQVPISVVHRRDSPLDGTRAGAALRLRLVRASRPIPSFRASRLSLLDRGFVFAIAHVRGGGEMGRAWYEDGRLEHKTNTFTDFIACAEHLIAQRLHDAGAARRARRQRGRPAHGRGREPAPRPLRGDRRRGPVRRRRHDDARSRRSRSRSPSGRSGATRRNPTPTRA